MARDTDDLLRGILGDDAYGAPSTMPSAAKGDSTGAAKQINDAAEHAKEKARSERPLSPFSYSDDSPPRTSGAPGGGYKFDAETISARIREFEDLKYEIDAKRVELQEAQHSATPPSFDPPAVGQAKSTQDSIGSAADHNQAMSDYLQNLLNSLHKANGTYVAHEENTTDVFKSTSSNSTLPPGTGTLFQKRENQ